MKNKLNYLSISLIAFFISCQEKKEPVVIKGHEEVPTYIKRNDDMKLTDSLFNLAISEGDERAYNTVSSDFILTENYKELLYYSLLMANKYNNPEAHFHVFTILSESKDDKSFKDLDSRTRNLALYHLVKSNELGYESAKYSINEIFDKGKKVENSSYYLTEYGNVSN